MKTVFLHELETSDLLASLSSKLCPSCGKPKREGQSLCPGEYHSLNRLARRALYARIGHGYEAAFNAALVGLGRETVYLPE